MNVDISLLQSFEDQLDPAFPDRSPNPPEILGYGEISATFAIKEMPGIAFKRMPPFLQPGQVMAYRKVLEQYHDLLTQSCHIPVSPYRVFDLTNRHDEHIVYVAQPRLPRQSIGNVILSSGNVTDMLQMVSCVMDHLLNLREFNIQNHPHLQIAIDGQISNWGFIHPESAGSVFGAGHGTWGGAGEGAGMAAVYFDITTPLFRIDGIEQLDTEIFLKSCPSPLVWLVRWQFLDEVVSRYYDVRLVLMDLAANFYKEGRADLIDPALTLINEMIREKEIGEEVPVLTREEIDRYYKNDAFIWTVFLALRRMDRFVKTRIFSKRYNFILPGKISR
ncbi:MAG: hypothetical protein C4548_07370 [Desulfobacteraceae bacterium]|nr:MAG: hypothetical protein C4548_07370 [Desulfobacteraceae bacterium]